MKTYIEIPALINNWPEVRTTFEDYFLKIKIKKKLITQMLLCIEEIFVNIANYAYSKANGNVQIECEYTNNNLKIKFTDHGMPFDPTKINTDSTRHHTEKLPIGGLGTLIVRKLMDEIHYSDTGGQNNLTLIKKLKFEEEQL